MPVTPLRRAREQRGLTGTAVAAELGLDQSYYLKVEKAKASTTPATARKIARFFGNAVTEHQILYPEDYIALSETPVSKGCE